MQPAKRGLESGDDDYEPGRYDAMRGMILCARTMLCDAAMLVIDLLCFDHHVFGGRPIYVTTPTS